MFHPQFGYGPRLWQGFQPSQVLPQPNFSVPSQFGPNNGPFSHMNVNQPRLPPNNNARWVHPPINPMIPQNHPRHFGPTFPQQLRPPGTDGEACFQMPGIPHHSPIAGQVSNPNAFNSQGPPLIPNAPILSPVHTSISNHPFSGQPLQNNQSLPGQPLNNSQPLPGQPLQNSQSFPGQLYHNTQPLSRQMFHNQASSSGQMNVFPGQISNPNLSLGNNNSVQVPPPLQPPLPPDPFPGQTLIHPPREPPMPTRSEKVPIKSRSKDVNFSSKDAKTHNSPSKKNHSIKTDHSSRKEQVSPRKRKSNQSPSSTKHDSKRCRHNSESFRKKERDHEDRSESNMKHNRNDLKTSQRDRNDQSLSNRDKCKPSMSDVNNHRSSHTRDPRSDKHVARRQDSKQGGDDHHSSFSQSIRPVRSVSPPAPDIKRKIKFIVPEDLYQLQREGTPPRTIVTATQELQKIYQTFEKKVLNTPNEVETTKIKDLPGTHKACNTQDTANRITQDNMELDSLDGNEFDVTESRPKGEYTEDVFGANDDTDDTDDDDNDSRGGDSSSDEECGVNPDAPVREYRQRKLSDPRRLHPDLWFNELGEGNDGPVCKCCAKDKEHGIRHAVYPGETDVPLCHPLTNNANKLHHYWVTVTPHCNFMTDRPTVIKHRDKDYVFEGFSIVSHEPLDWIPTCSFIRFNIEYTFHLIKEPLPKNFCIKGLELFSKFLFSNILELFDWTLKGPDKKGCPIFHFLPRFILHQNDKKDGHEIHELLSMDKVLYHLIKSSSEFVIKPRHLSMPRQKERPFAKAHYNNIVTQPNKKPAAFRIDDILFENGRDGKKAFPQILHHGIRPVQMCYAGNPKYQKLWKSYVRLRNTISNKPVASRKDHDRLVEIKIGLEKMKLNSSMRRDVEVRMSSEGLKKTGINSDVCQHAMVLPVLVHHLRYHICLKTLDSKLGYTFKDRKLLQLALTHPSYHLNFGMNPDQARNTLTNCGVKLPRYGDRKIHRMNTKKKGITQLIRVMANLGKIEENQSMIRHNERLEFLGDAVMEYMCSSHLYFMLPEESEGNLAIYRSALVQNSNLAILAKSFNLSDYMQYSHGPDLCKEEDLDHAMANCFEAILGAIFLEGGLPAATEFFTKMAFTEEKLRNVWSRKPKHPLQLQQPNGDRHLIKSSPVLQKLQEFEESIGIKFNHIRLLARAFTHPQVGFNNLTLGDNQRMEFLGDSVLQLVVSVYLYRHFPDHHEGHLTLLRSSLVNNRTQAEISRQLGMEKYINFGSKELKKIREKQLADVLEAFLAALYVDKGLKHIETFCRVCFFPRVEDNIVNQEWIDSKSQLQQCCLALRQGGKHPDLPVYKVLQDSGPSHHKKFQVGVYYKGKRVGTGEGHSLHVAEMTAAKDALASSYFPEMARQKHFLDGKHQEKRTRNYEPSKQREKPSEEKKTVQEPTWVEHE